MKLLSALGWLLRLASTGLAADKKLAVDDPAQVHAKVLYGTSHEKQLRANIELWISKAVAKAGSPLARPLTNWIALTGKNQRIHTSKQGGCIIDGKATEQDGKYRVVFDGCEGVPLDETVMLRPGERRVVNLSDNFGPNNIFVALEAPFSEQAKKRADALKTSAKTFRLKPNYNGDQDKPFYGLIVSVPPVALYRKRPFLQIMFVQQDEASKVIDHLARNGYFDHAVDLRSNIKVPTPSTPGYTMKVMAGDISLYEDLSWGPRIIQRLDGLRDALPDAGKKDRELLLGRLSGWRKQWEAEQNVIEAKVGRDDSRISFTKEDDKTIIDIASEFGIEKVTIRQNSEQWPKAILVRLHLSGLESFKAGNKEIAVEWSVSSTGKNSSRVSLRQGKEDFALGEESPYRTKVRIVGGNGKIPLKQGYFEVPLPPKLFEGNPEEIRQMMEQDDGKMKMM